MNRYSPISTVIGLVITLLVSVIGISIFQQVASVAGMNISNTGGISPGFLLLNTTITTMIPIMILVFMCMSIIGIFGSISRGIGGYSYGLDETEDDDETEEENKEDDEEEDLDEDNSDEEEEKEEIKQEKILDPSAFKIFDKEELIKKEEPKVEVPQSKPINRSSSIIVYKSPELTKNERKGVFHWIKKKQ